MTPGPGEHVDKPHAGGGGGCWGPAVGTPRGREGNLVWPRCRSSARLVHRLLPASAPPRIPGIRHFWAASPCGFLSPPPVLGFWYPKPLVPQSFSLSQARGCGSKSQPRAEGELSSACSWQDFGGGMSPAGAGWVLSPGPPQPCGRTLAGGAEPQRALALAEANQQLPNSWLPF